jgi:uncharacterized protein with beta-barrel porin domain
VDLATTADLMHHESVGTLFASQASADIVSTAGPPVALSSAINAGVQTRIGPEASIFARYETYIRQTREGANQTIEDLREWLERFELAAAVDAAIDTEIPPQPLRKRSLSVQTANTIATQVPRLRSAANSIESSPSSTPHELGTDDAEVSAATERLYLLSLDALPTLPREMACEQDERKRAREEYD